MPAFDGFAPADPQVELSPEHQRLLAIAVMLEMDEEVRSHWDFGEVWEVRDCGSVGCAWGWAAQRGIIPLDEQDFFGSEEGLAAVSLDVRGFDSIFTCIGYPGRTFAVTPDDVAARIRSHLATIYPALRAAAGVRTSV